MEFLNVAGNKIKDTFPFWLRSLQTLQVIGLRSNAFYGPIYNPSTYLGFPSLRIIDISNNNFDGSLPQDYFANWTATSTVFQNSFDMNYMKSDFSAYRSMDLAYKGVETDFVRIFRGFKAIDFSGNRFSGNIPGSIGLLSELRLLNLSDNAFTGTIPPSLAKYHKP
ncbi:receptor like protein 30-like [Arabidopsis lyrata subsp. lyrata]|uniref:receptor like protein 30-like n=1 Tax=Arabidopsis lyrata subsp. lyrata TaxID=81972 RepID=UPI000A29CC7F|nr:receptor like protein 30-like [Arabidopsis lyrata subsp. lyrata]|eukprot:XP_020886763.1 receptor like protein 30-like [Arabidopsis lyrata subsp. lyrata]